MNFSRRSVLAAFAFATGLIFTSLTQAEDDWTRFRGSSAAGASEKAAPTEWSPTKNIKWKTDLPGAGAVSYTHLTLPTIYSV